MRWISTRYGSMAKRGSWARSNGNFATAATGFRWSAECTFRSPDSREVRVTKRLRGKLYSVLEQLNHGHHVMRIYCKNLVGRLYEKFSTFLRVEVCVNRMKDLGLHKGLQNLACLRRKTGRDYGSFRRLRSAIPERARRLSPVPNAWLCRSWPAKPKSPASKFTTPA